MGIDGGDQVQVGVGRDGGADRGPHPSAGAEDGDTQGHGVGPYIPTASPSPANTRFETVVPRADDGHSPGATEHALDHRGHVLDRHGPQRGDILVDGDDPAQRTHQAAGATETTARVLQAEHQRAGQVADGDVPLVLA